MTRRHIERLILVGWHHRRSRLAGWALMGAGVAAGRLSDALAPAAVALLIGGVALSRFWLSRTDPVEERARRGNAAARCSAWSRGSEIVAGGYFTLGLAAVLLDADIIAVTAGVAPAVWIGAVFAPGLPPASTLRPDRPQVTNGRS